MQIPRGPKGLCSPPLTPAAPQHSSVTAAQAGSDEEGRSASVAPNTLSAKGVKGGRGPGAELGLGLLARRRLRREAGGTRSQG
jgi:hypothetical protein